MKKRPTAVIVIAAVAAIGLIVLVWLAPDPDRRGARGPSGSLATPVDRPATTAQSRGDRALRAASQGCTAIARRYREGAITDPMAMRLLQCHCAGAVVLSDDEKARLVSSLAEDASLELVFADPHADALCLLQLLASRPDLLPPGMWGQKLAEIGEGRSGGMMTADAQLVRVARDLLGRHPMDDLAWWQEVWDGLPESSGAIHVRRAIYEAIASFADAEARLHAWKQAASLENVAISGKANTALATLGLTIRDRSGGQVDLAAWASEAHPAWRRVLLWSIPKEGLWPRRKEALDPQVARAMRQLLQTETAPADGANHYLRLDLIGRAWSVLGPTAAAQEFAAYATAPRGGLFEASLWIARASTQVARGESSNDPVWRAAVDQTEGALATLLGSRHFDVSALIDRVLTQPGMSDRRSRDALVRLLGPRIHDLRRSTYARLVR